MICMHIRCVFAHGYVYVCVRVCVDILDNRSCGSEEGDRCDLHVLRHGRRGLLLHTDAAGRVTVCSRKTRALSAAVFTPCSCSKLGKSHKRPPFILANEQFLWVFQHPAEVLLYN